MNDSREDEGFATFLDDGRLEAATSDVAGWWTPDERARLSALVRSHGREPAAPARLTIRGVTVRLLPLESGGPSRYLAVFESLSATVPPFAELSERRRETARLAARGLTVQEIAEAMGLSPNTVKTQLRHVYDALGVSNRAELARLVEPG